MTIFTSDKKINVVLWLTYSAYLVLVAVIIWDTWIAATERFWIPLLLQMAPLLLVLPGLISKYYRSYSWLCFLSLAYFTSYVVQVYSPSRQWHDWPGLISTIIIFIAGMYASRWLQRYSLSLKTTS
ncbi:MAG: putative membrane protein [Cellvibrionaceae bacterium]|jgi:uncharacterized membrane protein